MISENNVGKVIVPVPTQASCGWRSYGPMAQSALKQVLKLDNLLWVPNLLVSFEKKIIPILKQILVSNFIYNKIIISPHSLNQYLKLYIRPL